MTKASTNKDLVLRLKGLIKEDWDKYPDKVYSYETGTIYLINKWDWGFHFFFINKEETKVEEFLYDLRHHKAYFKRNLKELKLRQENIDGILRSEESKKGWYKKYDNEEALLSWLETDNNKGMYVCLLGRLGSIGDEYVKMPSRSLVRLITEYSGYELLYKTFGKEGFPSKEMIINPMGTNVYEILDVNKTEKKIMSRWGISKLPRNMNQDERKKLSVIIYNYCQFVADKAAQYGLEEKAIVRSFYNREIDYIYQTGRNYYYHKALEIAERFHLNPHKCVEYAYFQCNVSQALDYSGALDNWYDYLDAITDMDYPNFDKYPRFLRTQHDVTMRNHKVYVSREDNERFANNMNPYKDMENSLLKGPYRIVVPTAGEDLIKEGNAQSNCVAGYVKNVINGTTAVVFMRDKDHLDESLVTIEVRDGHIPQAYIHFNYKLEKDQFKALMLFARKNRLTISKYLLKDGLGLEDELKNQNEEVQKAVQNERIESLSK